MDMFLKDRKGLTQNPRGSQLLGSVASRRVSKIPLVMKECCLSFNYEHRSHSFFYMNPIFHCNVKKEKRKLGEPSGSYPDVFLPMFK